jgi:hypothetical protein
MGSNFFNLLEQEAKKCISDARLRIQVCNTVADLVMETLPKPHDPSGAIEMVMKELSKHISEDNATVVQNLLNKHMQKTHPIYLHMVKNFKNHWYEILTKSAKSLGSIVSADCVKVPEMAARVVADTEKHAMNLALVAMINKKVYCGYYDTMIKEALAELTTPA